MILDRALALRHVTRLAARRPLTVAVETTSRCNARCCFCAHPRLVRPGGHMPLSLFERICEEYSEMGGGPLGLSPVVGDPLLDPLLWDRIALVRDRFPLLKLYVWTNGIGLAALSDRELLVLLREVEILHVSLGLLSREDYRGMFGVDRFQEVNDAVDRLCGLIEAHRPPSARGVFLHVRTARREETIRSERYRRLVERGLHCDDISDRFSDWGGVISAADLPPGASLYAPDQAGSAGRSVTCVIPVISMQVLADGACVACGCFDARREHVVGALSSERLGGIWTGERIRRFRSSFAEGECSPLCERCIHYFPFTEVLSEPVLRWFDPARENIWTALRARSGATSS